MNRVPFMPNFSDENPLILDEEEQKTIAVLSQKASAIQRKVILFLREAARKKGIISDTLEGLESKSGKPFVEEKKGKSFFGHDYRRAVVMGDPVGKLPAVPIETAYFCRSPFSPQKDADSCGWVKGQPIGKSYDDIGFLSGSAGIRYHCKICGQMIGEHRSILS